MRSFVASSRDSLYVLFLQLQNNFTSVNAIFSRKQPGLHVDIKGFKTVKQFYDSKTHFTSVNNNFSNVNNNFTVVKNKNLFNKFICVLRMIGIGLKISLI